MVAFVRARVQVVVVVVAVVAFAFDFVELGAWVGVAICALDWLVEVEVVEMGLGSLFGEKCSFFFESSRGAGLSRVA